MNPVNFGVIGAGWRVDFFMRIAAALPGRFRVVGVVARDPEKGKAFTERWGVPTFRTSEELFAQNPAFVVVSVPWGASVEVLEQCAANKIPVLAETPPAPDVAGLVRLTALMQSGAKIQVAEQYFLQPHHAAGMKVVHSGRIGTPNQAQISVAHGYHGISLMRKYLGIGFENATISGTSFSTPIVNSPGRNGPPETEAVVESEQVIARFEFENGKIGIYDFTGDQYFSFVRAPRILVRGERGEYDGETARFLLSPARGVSVRLQREDTGHFGNLEGYCHRGYTLGEEVVYQNAFEPGRLSDDEIAIATMLENMADYVSGGQPLYPLKEAAQDRYLDISMEEAVRTGKPVQTTSQIWATEGE